MNHFLIAFKEEQANVEYCAYCLNLRGDQRGCCQENHWIEFKDMDDETQQRIAEEEYEWMHHKGQK